MHVTPVVARRAACASLRVRVAARRRCRKRKASSPRRTPPCKRLTGERKGVSPFASARAYSIRDPRQDSPYRRLRPKCQGAARGRGRLRELARARCGTTTGSTPAVAARRRGLPRGRQRAAVRRRPDGAICCARAVPERAHGGQHRGVLGEDAARGGGVTRRSAASSTPCCASRATAGASRRRRRRGEPPGVAARRAQGRRAAGRLRPVRAAAARPPRRPRPQRPPSALEPEGLLRRARRRRLARRVGGAVRAGAARRAAQKSAARRRLPPRRGGRRQRARLRAGRRAAVGVSALAPFVP